MSIEQHLQKLRDSDIHACLAAVSELGDLVAARRDRSFTKGMIGPELVAAIERFTSNDLQEHFVFGEKYGLRRGKAYELVVNYLCDLSDCNSSETNRTASSGLFSFFQRADETRLHADDEYVYYLIYNFAAPIFIANLYTNRDASIRCDILESLRFMLVYLEPGKVRQMPPVIDAIVERVLNDDDKNCRYCAVLALRPLSPDCTAPYRTRLVPALQDSDSRVREWAKFLLD